METWCLFCCNKQVSKASKPNGKHKEKCGWKPCVPKEFLVIWFIITLILLLTIDYMSKTPYQISQTIPNLHIISQHEAMNFSSIFSHYIHKNYTLLQESAKNLIFVYVVGIEGTGHHFFAQLFNNLIQYHKIKSANYTKEAHYYHQVDALRHGLLYNLMQDCFQYNQYGEQDPLQRLNNLNASLHKRHDINSYKNMNSCDGVQKDLNELSMRLPNNSVLFHAGFSYPFGDPFGSKQLTVYQYPDIIKIVQWAQNTKPYPFDLRFLVLKRHKWSVALQSVVSRYCKKLQRIRYIKLMLSVIQTHLLGIDNQFWIILDFDHLLQNTMEYVPLLMPYFFRNIDSNQQDFNTMKYIPLLKQTLKQTLENKPVSNYTNSKCLFTSNQLNDMLKYLRIDSPHEWPVFNENKFIVMPNNTQFLKQKYFMK